MLPNPSEGSTREKIGVPTNDEALNELQKVFDESSKKESGMDPHNVDYNVHGDKSVNPD